VPGRAASQAALQFDRGRSEAKQVLVVRLSEVPAEIELHHWRVSADHALEHEDVLEKMQRRLEEQPDASRMRRSTVEHTFGTLKAWMGSTHFLTRTLPRVSTEMSLHVLAYNMKRALQLLGAPMLIVAMAG
jgi:capsular polysaccharide biosynthesis protein